MKVIKELWLGSLRPSEQKLSPESELYKLTERLARREEALLPLLSDTARKVYKELRENQSELSSLNVFHAFATGFKLGVKMMHEVMEDNDDE